MNLASITVTGRRASALAASALIALIATGCGRKADEDAGKPPPSLTAAVLAEVGGELITADDLIVEARRRLANRQPALSKEDLLEQMVERAAILHRARAAKLDQDPEVKRALENLLIGQFRERESEQPLAQLSVSEEELQDAYQQRIADFTQPAKVRVAILYLRAGAKVSEGQREEVRARLEEAREKAIANPAPGGRGPAAQGFGALAINYSDDQVSRYRGGDVGWLDRDTVDHRLPKTVLEAAFAGEKGAVSEVIETDDGFYLAMKSDIREEVVQPFAKTKTALQARLLRDKRERLLEALREETKASAGSKIYPQALASVKLPVTTAPTESKPPTLPGGVAN